MATITPSRRSQRSTNHSKQMYTMLLGSAAVAVVLVAALTAWAAQLGGGAWLPVLAPFALVLAVPFAALAWLYRAEDASEPAQASSSPGKQSSPLWGRVRFGRGVPLARRNLFQDRRRVLLSTGGVAVALLLVLILGGIFAGAMRQLTNYIDHTHADLVVSQAGVTTMHMSTSVLRPVIADRILETPGVAWVEPIRYTTGMVSSAAGQSASYVIGYEPTARHAGPSRLVTGRPPGPREAVVDRQAADQLRLRVGATGSASSANPSPWSACRPVGPTSPTPPSSSPPATSPACAAPPRPMYWSAPAQTSTPACSGQPRPPTFRLRSRRCNRPPIQRACGH